MAGTLQKIQGRRDAQEKKGLNRILLAGLVLYTVLSSLYFFGGQELSSPILISYLIGYFVLLAVALYQFLFNKAYAPYGFIWLGAIGLSILVQMTGGLDSPARYLYILLIAAAAFQIKKHAYGISAVVLSMDVINMLLSGHSSMQILSALGLDAALGVMLILFVPVLSRLKRHAETSRERYRRLLADARAVDPLSRHRSIETLSAEGLELSNVSFAVSREAGFKGLIDIIAGLVPAHTYAVFANDGNSDVFTLRCIKSESRHTVPEGRLEVVRGRGLIGICFDKDQPQYLAELAVSSKSLGYYTQDLPIRSFLFVPVLQGDMTIGGVVLDSLEKDAFSPEDQDLLMRFSPFFGQIMEKVRISQELDLRAKIAHALHYMSTILNSSLELSEVLEKLTVEMKKIVPYEACAFVIFNDDGQATIAAQLGYAASCTGLLFHVSQSAVINQMLEQWRTRKATEPYDFPDLGGRGRDIAMFPFKEMQGDFRSMYCQPLAGRDKFFGAFVMACRHANAFARHHKDFVATLMNQVAAVIDNTDLHRRVKDMALTDGLTGLLNHRTFMEKLDEEFRRLDRETTLSFSILLLDIDYFKKVNDTYGHPVGDQALRHVASIIRSQVRNIDFVARYGGEEFAVGMVNASSREAEGLAERIRKAVANSVVTAGRNAISITVSIGVASIYQGCKRKEDLIALADEALYEAKRGGRNMVQVAKGSGQA